MAPHGPSPGGLHCLSSVHCPRGTQGASPYPGSGGHPRGHSATGSLQVGPPHGAGRCRCARGLVKTQPWPEVEGPAPSRGPIPWAVGSRPREAFGVFSVGGCLPGDPEWRPSGGRRGRVTGHGPPPSSIRWSRLQACVRREAPAGPRGDQAASCSGRPASHLLCSPRLHQLLPRPLQAPDGAEHPPRPFLSRSLDAHPGELPARAPGGRGPAHPARPTAG